MTITRPTEAPRKRGKSSLGNTTKSASTPAIYTDEHPTDKRYRLQKKAQELLPSERVCRCMHSIQPGKSVNIMVNDKSAWFSGTMVCSSVWHCPVCASRIGNQRAEELRTGIANWYSRDKTVVLVTYTMAHSAYDSVSESLTMLKAALRRMKSGRRFQEIKQEWFVVGTVKNIEVTHGQNGWHPHCHELWFLDRPLSFTEIDHLETELQKQWVHVLGLEQGSASLERGLTAKSARKDIYAYVTKFGKLPADANGDAVEYELTHSHQKRARRGHLTPFQLLDSAEQGDKQAAVLFREYAFAFKGTKQLHYSRALKELLGIDNLTLSDEQAAQQEPEQAEIFMQLSTLEWRCVVEYDYRSFVLELGRKRSKERLRTFLAALTRRKTKLRL